MALTKHQREFIRCRRLHGKAFCAVNAFVEAMVSPKELEAFEEKHPKAFYTRNFYPQKLILLAKRRLTKLFRAAEAK